MIRNGLYAVTSKLLDGVEGGATGVSVLQGGTMRGGGSTYYHVGSYTCSGGKWKGELTTQEHEPGHITTLFAQKVVTMGFTGTYTDDGAEFEATALVGKRSVRLKVVFRLLIADGDEAR
jgi:T3SS negative regulator,GrlR